MSFPPTWGRSSWTARWIATCSRRTPLDATPFTRVMPLASSGASSPLSAASTASLRTAVMRVLSVRLRKESPGYFVSFR
jgi:hypothetical protein